MKREIELECDCTDYEIAATDEEVAVECGCDDDHSTANDRGEYGRDLALIVAELALQGVYVFTDDVPARRSYSGDGTTERRVRSAKGLTPEDITLVLEQRRESPPIAYNDPDEWFDLYPARVRDIADESDLLTLIDGQVYLDWDELKETVGPRSMLAEKKNAEPTVVTSNIVSNDD